MTYCSAGNYLLFAIHLQHFTHCAQASASVLQELSHFHHHVCPTQHSGSWYWRILGACMIMLAVQSIGCQITHQHGMDSFDEF